MKVTSTHPFTKIIVNLLLAFVTTTATSQSIAPPEPEESFSISLYFTGSDSIRNLIDNATTVFNNNFSALVDNNDLLDDPNATENIAIARDGFYLTMELRPVIEYNDTIPLFMEHMISQNYEMEFTGSNFSNPLLVATLIDNYTGDRTILSIDGTVLVLFTVTSDPASSTPGRFMIVFGTPGALAISGITINACQKTIANVHGIQVNWVAKTELDMDRYELERSANGRAFSKLAVQSASGNNGESVKYSWFDKGPLTTNNFYRIKAIDRDGSIKYSSIIKSRFVNMNIAKIAPAIIIYPNPVTGSNLHLQLKDLAKGTYKIIITSNQGLQVFSAQFQHSGGSATQTIELNNNLANGTYQLHVSGAGVNLMERLNRVN